MNIYEYLTLGFLSILLVGLAATVVYLTVLFIGMVKSIFKDM